MAELESFASAVVVARDQRANDVICYAYAAQVCQKKQRAQSPSAPSIYLNAWPSGISVRIRGQHREHHLLIGLTWQLEMQVCLEELGVEYAEESNAQTTSNTNPDK